MPTVEGFTKTFSYRLLYFTKMQMMKREVLLGKIKCFIM